MIRTKAFGYTINKGKTMIDDYQSEIVKTIFAMYKDGKSLKAIASFLSDAGKRNAQGIVKWDKARLSRILSDKAYIGSEIFPQIIAEDDYYECNKLREKKTEKPQYEQLLKDLAVPVKCGRCGSKMNHIHTSKNKRATRWYCAECKSSMPATDDEFIEKTTYILNALSENLFMLGSYKQEEQELPLELVKAERRIETAFLTYKDDVSQLKQDVRELVSMKYDLITDDDYFTELLKLQIAKADIKRENIVQIINTIRCEVLIKRTGSIWLILPNGLMVGKEEKRGSRSNNNREENSNDNSCGLRFVTVERKSA